MNDSRPHPLKGVTGSDHPRWKTDLDKAGAERRLTRLRGRASDNQCSWCEKRALHWVLARSSSGRRSIGPRIHWSTNADDYDPMCRRHRNLLCPNLETMREYGIIKVT